MVYVSFVFLSTFLLSSQVLLAQEIQKEERIIGTHKRRVHHQLEDSTSGSIIDYHQYNDHFEWTIPTKRDHYITYVSDYYPSIILPMLLNIPKNPLIPPKVSNPWVTPIPPCQKTPWILPIPPSQNTPWTTPTPPFPTSQG
ncbi:hypothetical protein PIB30_000463 [Stylosanthes scabra]|uniref:Uncharacterized protein n=1 Tax=Stylosanthes scabra TaxID=79078 RepID=A0ABU6V0T6_9FABA|nr:hypothetical protein [Stylosanthes scabra]